MANGNELLIPKQETSFFGDTKKQYVYGSFQNSTANTIIDEEGEVYHTAAHYLHPCSNKVTTVLNGNTTVKHTSGAEPGIPSSRENDYRAPPPPSLNVVGLSYTVKDRPGQWWNGSCFRQFRRKTILHNLSMNFQSGQLTALVGNSGSGKTSLLDIIAGRAQGEVTGVVSYKHQVCSRDLMKRCSSYVLQADRHLYTLTVREMLTYMAYLKLPGHYIHSQIDEKVEAVLSSMGLHHVANTRIGGAVVRGVSGGEKRRITIGIQLLKDPEILLLDEPTSGLDAFTAHHLVSSLAKLAHEGKMVIMSIHQPRSDIFNLLDKIAILTVGRLAFLGRPNQLVPYFTSIGYPCPVNQNPCDVYIDVTSVDRRTHSSEKTTFNNALNICNSFANSDLQAGVIKQITSGLNHHYSEAEAEDELKNGISSDASWPRVFSCILNRMNVHLYRDRSNFTGRLIFLPFFVPFIAIFVGRFKDNQESIQDRLGILYQCVQVPAYMGFTNAIAMFPVVRDLYYRESSDGLYSVLTFSSVYFLHILPFNIITASAFASIIYWLVGFQDSFEAFGQFLIMMVILIQFGEMLTVTFLAIFRNVMLANVTAALVLWASGLIASGLLRSTENMPQTIQWVTYIAIHKYATEIMANNEFEGLSLYCGPFGTGKQCKESGDVVLAEYFPTAGENVERNWIMMCGYFIGIWLLVALVFKIRGNPTLH